MDQLTGDTTHCRYTPALLAELLGVTVADIRSWQRRGLIHPVETVNRVPYFDFTQLAAGRQLVNLLGQGITPAALERKLQRLADWLPEHSLANLALRVDGNEVLLRRDGQIVESGGQKRFDFDGDPADHDRPADIIPLRLSAPGPGDGLTELPHADDGYRLKRLAEQLEDAGEIHDAIRAWRTFHLACGPRAESCFRLGELLYLTGDGAAARERYFMALEMDPNLVEVRASLGCVLIELGEIDLAISALRGALEYHADYPDVHYHLAAALELARQPETAVFHWQTFLQLCPVGPWADQARDRLTAATVQS